MELTDQELTEFANIVKEGLFNYLEDKGYLTNSLVDVLKRNVIVNYCNPEILGSAIKYSLRSHKVKPDEGMFFISEIKRVE